ncbi:hypothetical protein A7981_00895 [Methylovorus sp. MM2]|uniref:hypothetical protein n=1 Tax=Methylovorus sp. MM2 TaxID=1848038 RepID=UPI0007DF0D92|nr:hypothetical protein [Methylovorus sp. MM2]OAM52081.1 hypothetical protein A7981_00895 [Methylovorus sp. MM2]
MAAKKTDTKKPLPTKLTETETVTAKPGKQTTTGQVKTVAKKTVAHSAEAKQPVNPKKIKPKEVDPKKPQLKKPKLIRDSYAIPSDEYAKLQQLKERCLAKGQTVKKSELLRAGILKLAAMRDTELLKIIASIASSKIVVPPKS